MASITINFDVAQAPAVEAPVSEDPLIQQVADLYGVKRSDVHEVDSDTEQPPAKVARVTPFTVASLKPEVLAEIVEASEEENVSLWAIQGLIGKKSSEAVMVDYNAMTKAERVEAYGDTKLERAQARSEVVDECRVHLLKGLTAAKEAAANADNAAQAGDLSADEEEPAQEYD